MLSWMSSCWLVHFFSIISFVLYSEMVEDSDFHDFYREPCVHGGSFKIIYKPTELKDLISVYKPIKTILGYACWGCGGTSRWAHDNEFTIKADHVLYTVVVLFRTEYNRLYRSFYQSFMIHRIYLPKTIKERSL